MKPGRGERAAQVLVAVLKSGCYLALFLGMQVLVMLPAVLYTVIQMTLEGGSVEEDLILQAIVDQSMVFSLIANVLTLAVVLIFYLVQRKKLSEALWLRRVDAPTLWVGVSLAPALYLVVTLVLAALPEAWLESYTVASSGITGGGAAGVLAVVVAAPVVEEIVFRGLIMTRLSKAMPGWLAVVLSAAVFGACHGHPVWFGYAFVLGSVFGFMDLRAGSIWPSMLGHVFFNSFSQILSALPEDSGAQTAVVVGMAVAAIVLPILDRKGIAGLFRPRPREEPLPALSSAPGEYEFDPWEE